eukprot:g5339.t1
MKAHYIEPAARCPEISVGRKQASVFCTNSFVEAIPLSILDSLLDSNLLRVDSEPVSEWKKRAYTCPEKTHLQKLRGKVKNNFLTVNYRHPKSGYGRVQAKKAFSLGVLRKEVRHTLCEGGDWLDFDIVNCHPTIFLQVCNGHGILAQALQNYCNHREKCLEEVCTLFTDGFTPANRDKAKNLFIRILYGGSEKKWLKEYNLTGPVPSCLTELKTELSLINKNLQSFNSRLVAAVKKMEPKDTDRSFMSYYAHEWERRILECVYEMMTDRKYIVNNDCVLCYDGIMIHKKNLGSNVEGDVARECEAVVYKKLGFKLRFEIKPMKKSLMNKLSELEKNNGFKPEYHDECNFEYMKNLSSYRLQKIYFEQYFAKALRPDVVFLWTAKRTKKDAYETTYKEYETVAYGEGKIKAALTQVQWAGQPFFNKWNKDPSMRYYTNVDFLPYNGIFDPFQNDRNVYNLFKGYNPAIDTKVEKEKQDKYLKPFLDLGIEIFEGDREFLLFFLETIAHKVQYPRKKLGLCFIIQGSQGVGKNVFMDAIGRVVDRTHYYSTVNAEDLYGKHAIGFVNKLIVVLNECEHKNTFALESALKASITDTELTVNAKNQQPRRVQNLAMLIVTTNKSNPLPIDTRTGDRRYLVCKATDVYLKKSSKFWAKLTSMLRQKEFIASLYQYLNNLNVENIDWKTKRKKFLGESYKAMVQHCIPTEVLYFMHLLCLYENCVEKLFDNFLQRLPIPGSEVFTKQEQNGMYRFTRKALYDDATVWASGRGSYKRGAPSIHRFFTKLQENKIPFKDCAMYNGRKTVIIAFTDVKQALVDRKYIDGPAGGDTGCAGGNENLDDLDFKNF